MKNKKNVKALNDEELNQITGGTATWKPYLLKPLLSFLRKYFKS